MLFNLHRLVLLLGFIWLALTPLRAFDLDTSLGPQALQGFEALQQHNDREAFKDFKRAHENGNVLGTTLLGIAYMEGRGTKVDYYLAKTYFDSALRILKTWREGSGIGNMASSLTPLQSSTALLVANYGLATMMQQGLGMPKDPKQALKMYRGIIIQLGANGVGTVMGTNPATSPIQDPNAGVLDASDALIDGMMGLVIALPFKHVINLKLLHASSFKNPIAKEYTAQTLYQIGVAYKMGIGTGKKRKKAIKFLEKAVEFGNKEAMQALEGLE
ncbi:tetratricopeptide repeat protein [Helicobacter felis]|uniref:tetratricopeptide repeat protein n=1 Tax=Helicobacter felis TaxID=214 RepID=UPI000CF1532C|nr:SEL1-like repeat protein [Helicobacter felis]